MLPIQHQLTNERLNQLLTINLDHSIANSEETSDSVDQNSPSISPILCVVCSYCNAQIDRDQYLLHVREHLSKIFCMECDHLIGELADVFTHDKKEHGINRIDFHCAEFAAKSAQAFQNTKVIFNNGLVLYNLNLVGTEYDTSNTHTAFIQVLIDLEREKYRKLYQPNGLDDGNKSENDPNASSVDQNDANSKRQVLQSMENQSPATSQLNSYAMELRKQNEFTKNLIIKGIPELKNENLTEIFVALCNKVDAKVNLNDILGIERCKSSRDTIIVKFKHLKDKKTVRRIAKGIWSSDLVKLPPNVPKTQVFVYPQLTEFFSDIIKVAESARAQGTLHSYQLSKDGVIVKRTSGSTGKIVLSKEQLENFIK